MPFNSFKSLNKINFKEMLIVALNKWFLLPIFLFSAALISFVYTGFIVHPLYDSTGKIYIQNQEKMEDVTTTELSTSSYLAYDYQNLISDRAILDDVARRMGYKYSYNALRRSITVENPEFTRFIEITVRTKSPEDSQKIVNCLIDISKERIVELLNIDQITVIRRGELPIKPAKPDKIGHLRASLIVGILVFLFSIAVIYIFDDKVKDDDDVQNYLGMTLLGSIPYAQNKAAKGAKP